MLPAPDMEPKKRRGGKRFRKMKERYGLTGVRNAANRVNFNQPEEEVIDGDEVRAHRPGHCQKGGAQAALGVRDRQGI